MRADLPTAGVAAPARAPLLQWRMGRLTSAESWMVALAALLWLVFTLPMAFLSQWFPMDMPALFEMGGDMDKWLPWILSPYNGSGRYFPAYWLYWTMQFQVFGDLVWPYLLLQSVLFMGGAALTSLLVHRATRSVLAAAATFVGIYLASPVAENLATMGKGEPLSYVFVACILWLLWTHRMRSLASVFAVGVLFALAIWVKETALVLFGFAFVGLVLAAGGKRLGWWGADVPAVRPYAVLLGALAAGFVLTRVPYFAFTASKKGTIYTDYEITPTLVLDNLYFYLTQQPDVLMTGVVATAGVLYALVRQARKPAAGVPGGSEALVFMASVCAMGWGYWLAMQIWRWPMAYYMLLPSIAFKASVCYGIWVLARGLRSRWPRNAGLTVLALALAWGTLVLLYVTSSQVAFSRIYTEALRQVKQIGPGEHRLVIETLPFFAEQIAGTESVLRNQLHSTVKVGGIGELVDPAVLKPDLMKLLGVTPELLEANKEQVPQRGDLLLTFTGDKLGTWFLRGVTPYYVPDSFLRKEGMYDMELIASREIVTRAVYVHIWHDNVAASRTWVGYKLHRVLSDRPKFLWSGRFQDGWIGERTSLRVNPEYGMPLTFAISAPPYVLPTTVTIKRDGRPVRTVELTTPDEVVLELGPAPVETTDFTFDVPRSFVGKQLKLNQDERKLAARVALVHPPASGRR